MVMVMVMVMVIVIMVRVSFSKPTLHSCVSSISINKTKIFFFSILLIYFKRDLKYGLLVKFMTGFLTSAQSTSAKTPPWLPGKKLTLV